MRKADTCPRYRPFSLSVSCLSRSDFLAFDETDELALRFRHVFDIHVSDDANGNAFADTERKRRIHRFTRRADAVGMVKENIHLLALTRVHGVGDDTIPNLRRDQVISAVVVLDGGTFDGDDGAEGKNARKIAGEVGRA